MPQSEMVEKTVEKKVSNNKTSAILSVIAIIISLATSANLYRLLKKQTIKQSETNDVLVKKIITLQKAQWTQKFEFDGMIKQKTEAIVDVNAKQDALTKQLDEIQQWIAPISVSDRKVWMVSQADFLVKLAGHKLWSDQDISTTAALLKSADASLANINDPSLINARRAITEDIAGLATVSRVDYDGIILKVNQLSNQIDNLRLTNNNDDLSRVLNNKELSSSISEWRLNLKKSWQNFMDSFITIRHRNEMAAPLLAPKRDVYLRENIRFHLLMAAQAVIRHHQKTYKQMLENVVTWIRAYYDTSDESTMIFLDEIKKLSQQNITMNVPNKLKSQLILEKLMQTRVRNLLAQPGIGTKKPNNITATAVTREE